MVGISEEGHVERTMEDIVRTFFLPSLDRDVLLVERQVVHFWQWEFVSHTRNANHINFA